MHKEGNQDYCTKLFKRFPTWDCCFPEKYEIEHGEEIERVYIDYFIAGSDIPNTPQEVWHWKKGQIGERLAEGVDSKGAYDFVRGLVMLDKGIDISKNLTLTQEQF